MTEYANVVDFLNTTLRSLKTRSFDALRHLPDREESRVRLPDGEYSVMVWKDDLAEGEIRLVVQAYRYRVFGIGKMTASGFIVSKQHGIRDLRNEELWEFM